MLNSSSVPLASSDLAALLAGWNEFDPCPENGLLKRYIEGGCAYGRPLPLALGETWSGAPGELVELLSAAPAYCDGYQLSPFGLPDLQCAVIDWLSRDYALALASAPLLFGTSATGTRSVMHAYGDWLARDHWRTHPVYLTSFSPSWDYRGVFVPLGFIDNPVELMPQRGFLPDVAAIEAAINSVPRTARQLIILNPQHNPTARNWPADLLKAITEMAIAAGAALLIDDAYFGLTDSGTMPSSALGAVIATSPRDPSMQFLLVRSLGKQFGCNGWAIGAYIGVEASVLGVQRQLAARSLNAGARLQWALSRWIGSASAARDVMQRRETQRAARTAAERLLLALGLVPEDIAAGDATPFLVFRIPPAFRAGPQPAADFLVAAAEYGVYLSPLMPSGRGLGQEQGNAWVRMYLGLGPMAVTEAIERLAPLAARRSEVDHAG